MKVLLVSPVPPPYGGISHWTALIRDYAQEAAPNLRLEVMDTAPRRRRQLNPKIGRRLLEGVVRMVVDVSRFTWSLTRLRPDVVHLNTSGQLAFVRDFVILAIAKAYRVPVAYHLRFGRLPDLAAARNWEWKWAARALGQATKVIVLDRRTEDVLIRQRLALSVLIPNPIPDDRVVDHIGDSGRENVVFFAGWLIETKGVAELLEAWARLNPTGWTLQLAGPVDTDYLKTLDIPSGVEILGPLGNAEILARMRLAKIFAFPSHTEGFPNAVAEAMASGMAVIATDVGAIPEMLEGGAGLVIPARHPHALVSALESLIVSKDARNCYAMAALRRASQYSLTHVFKAYEELWFELATRSARWPKGAR